MNKIWAGLGRLSKRKGFGYWLLGFTALIALVSLLHAQTAINSGINGGAISGQPPASDTIVNTVADEMGLTLMSPDQLPRGGTFWWVMPGGSAVPTPCPPPDPNIAVYQVADGQFIADTTGGQVVVRNSGRLGLRSGTTFASAVQAQASGLIDLINQIQDNAAVQQLRMVARALGMDFPGFGDGGGGGGSGYTNSYPNYTFDTNQLWLEITNVSNGSSYLNLHNASNQVYAIWTTTNLLTPWNVETEVWPSDPNCESFSLQNNDRQYLFVRAEDWSTKDSDSDGIPDWWTWKYFGSPTLADTNLDYSTNIYYPGYGCTFGYEYSNNITPTVFRYTGIHATNNYVGTSQSVGLLDVAGTPYYIAVSVDDTNFFTNATWNTYSSANVPVNVGSVEGWHEIWIGLRGHAETEKQAVWQHLWLKLDNTPPVLVITNPVNTTVDIPMIQIQGYSPEALRSISYDLTNAAGAISNQTALILNQYYDPNMAEYTTNWFQAFDVFLTNGLNALTFHATDLAGNMATFNYHVTVDYSAKTNPPNVQLIWPVDGMSIASDSVTVRGLVDDATVKVIASVNDIYGVTNTVAGVVERDGRFWLDNVPLMAGTNVIALTATDAAGNVTTHQLELQRSSITVTVNPPVITNALQTTVSVSGTVSDPTAVIWVNGVQGTNYGDGTWSADNVPVTRGGVAIFDVMAYPVDEAPDPGSGGGGINPPPTPGSGSGGIGVDMPPSVYLYEDNQAIGDKNNGTSWDWDGGSGESDSETHSSHWWMPGWGGAGGESSHSDGKTYQDGSLSGSSVYNMIGSYDLDGYGNGWETGTIGNSSSFSQAVWRGPTWQAGLVWWVGNEHCEVVDTKNTSWQEGGASGDPIFGGGTSHDSYERSAQTTYHVQTGGRAIPGRQNLWRFSAGASWIKDKHATPPFWSTPNQAIDPTQVWIRGQHLDTNGNTYIVLPDGQDLDVTPQVPGLVFYTFGVGGQKYLSHFEVFVRQPYPRFPDDYNDYGPDGPPFGYPVYKFGGLAAGHAWWKLYCSAPIDGINKFTSTNCSQWLNKEVGYGPVNSSFDCWACLINATAVKVGPGFLSTNNGSADVHRTYAIGFQTKGLIDGLGHTENVHQSPGEWDSLWHNCVHEAVVIGKTTGIQLPYNLNDSTPDEFGRHLPPDDL